MTDRVSERRRAAQLARHYRDREGLTIAEIARRLGRAEGTVKAYLYDPIGERAREVKARYRGVCRGCGAPTSARNGKGDAYAYCKRCRPGAIERQWNRHPCRRATPSRTQTTIPQKPLDNQTTGQVSRSHTCAGQSAGLIDVGQRPFLPTAIVAFRPEAVLRRRTTPRCLWVESPQPGGRGATRRFLVLSQRTTPGRVRPSVWLQSARHERVLAHAPRSRLRLPPPCEARDRGR